MSKITHFGIRNFLTIIEAVLEFDETGIINLVGYNDSGKSAVTRAIEVLFYDKYRNEQVKCIHRGKSVFEVFAMFDDGVRIGKLKYESGMSVWSMTKSGEVLYTNKRDKEVISVDGVPKVIRDYLGVIQEPETQQNLNVRRNTDKLFLINTTGSENYKMITKILKIDVLNEAVKMINTDRNALTNKVSSIDNTIQMLKRELSNVDLVKNSELDNLEELANNIELLVKQESILERMKENLEVMEVQLQPKVELIDNRILGTLEELNNSLNILENQIQPEISQVDNSVLVLMGQIEQSLETSKTVVHPIITPIDTTILDNLTLMGDNLTIMGEPVQPKVNTVNTQILELFDTMEKHYSDSNTLVQPEVATLNTKTLSKYALMDELSVLFTNYETSVQDRLESTRRYEEHMNKIQELSKVQNISICSNCGLLAV